MGWSGRTAPRRGRATSSDVSRIDGPAQLATIDLTPDEFSLFYTGFSNRTLWPLMHSFIERTQIRHDSYRVYRGVNRRYAQALYPLLEKDDSVWIHDYHLFPLGEEIRRLGWNGKLGFFLHTPFPPADVFSILPWASEVLSAMLAYDLIGVHTRRYLLNLVDAFRSELGGDWNGFSFAYGGNSARLGVYPIGIEPAPFQDAARRSTLTIAGMFGLDEQTRIIIGVDRLDYTKGIPHRLRAYSKLLEHHRALRGKVTFLQISNPSRARVPEYVRERESVERLTGQINGRYSDGSWIPVRYLYRNFSQETLAALYRDADVNMVTPLRDGMNLIAKEFVVSQVHDPGVLMLSSLAGSSAELTDALIVNPFDIDGTAASLYDALTMPLAERERRWKHMNEVVEKSTASLWSATFTDDLARAAGTPP